MATELRTICAVCCEANSPPLARCYLCGATLNHELKSHLAMYEEMLERKKDNSRAGRDPEIVSSESKKPPSRDQRKKRGKR